MLKNLMYVACLLGALEAHAASYTHPLNNVLKSLKEAATEIDAVQSQADPDIKEEAAQLKAGLGEVAKAAIVAPLNISSRRISRFGYDIVARDNDISGRSTVKENAGINTMNEEAFALVAVNWISLQKISTDAAEEMRNIAAGLEDYNNILSPVQKGQISNRLDLSVADSYRTLQKRASTTIACITHFAQAFPASGLIPVRNGSDYAWSPAELKAKFGVQKLTDLPPEKRKTVAEAVRDHLVQAARYARTCVSKEAFRFMNNEKKSLEQEQ